jgi:hypothetical protein
MTIQDAIRLFEKEEELLPSSSMTKAYIEDGYMAEKYHHCRSDKRSKSDLCHLASHNGEYARFDCHQLLSRDWVMTLADGTKIT